MSNQADARRRAETALKNAKDAGVTGKTLAQLQAEYEAAVAAENSAKGSSGQARSWF